MGDNIDSNATGTYIAEESTLKTLPGTPVWYEGEPDSYSDVGGDYSYVARNPINANRQDKKGTITDLDAVFGMTMDVTQNNTKRLMQGFMWAAAREKFATQSLGSAAIAITAVDGVNNEYEAASGLDDAIVNNLLFASNFTNSGNNGLKLVTAAAAGAVEVSETLTAEASPPSTASVEAVGFQFPSGDLDVAAGTNTATLSTTTTDCTTLGLNVGEWVYVNGDSASTYFANNGGYARVLSVSTNAIVLDKTEWSAVNETGTELTIQMFFGTFIRNEQAASIVRTTYQGERQLGEDADGVQSEYITGCIPNEYTENIPTAEKLNCEIGFVGMDAEYRNGATGIKSGTRVSALNEDCFNTSSDVFVNKLYVHDATTTNPDALIGYFSDSTFTINNNVQPNKAIGVLGAFEASAGNIQFGGSGTAYFRTVSELDAVRNSSDLGWHYIVARENGGIVTDIPLCGASGGRANVEKDSPITIALELMGAENDQGYTASKTFFSYLPDAAMPA